MLMHHIEHLISGRDHITNEELMRRAGMEVFGRPISNIVRARKIILALCIIGQTGKRDYAMDA